MDSSSITRKSAETCRKIQKKFGKSYYFATLFLPKEKRQATQVLYAFFRMPDEIVDNPSRRDITEVKKSLLEWKDNWAQACETGLSEDPILDSTAKVFRKYSIPYSYSGYFLDAMITDTEKFRYENYRELEKYMFGSAAAVGLIMSHIIGFSDKKALKHAEMLGYAMQLTNFLRDIGEDYVDRGRIYLPRDEMDKFGISENDISSCRISDNFRDFIKFEIGRARQLYKESEKGIAYLHKDGRFAVRMASVLYETILDKIEKLDCNVFAERAHTNAAEKLLLLLKESLKR